jgi:hypothetical protein
VIALTSHIERMHQSIRGIAGLTLLLLPGAPAAGAQQPAHLPQGVDYRIEAALDEATSVLSARARLRYSNRSQQRLDTLYFHQHLNAFRPNSAWAKRELQFGQRRFQDLGDDAYAFQRLRGVRVNGRAVTPVYPGGDDSTVVAIPLPGPLAPGGSATLLLDWDARLSTTPRRQGRRGRHHDFAQWYPRIAAFDRGGWQVQPLLPQGEFYGEFASYDVTLDVASDQVIGATGVPVAGDPGWSRTVGTAANIRYQRDAYPARAAESIGLLPRTPAEGRKQVRWRAEQVHNFAWTTNPDYIYEGGEHRGIAIHVLFQPGDTAWDDGVAVQRTAQALAHYDTLFGPYPYPQITNVHRVEGGGTEFPMMVMNGDAGFGLILHEVGHQWLHGILANNEFKEGWLDEGFTSFTNSWFAEQSQGPEVWLSALRSIVALEQARRTQPIATAAQDFVDFNTYNAMTYTKPALVLRMLRDLVGEANTRKALRDYYDRHKFKHVTERDLQAAFERVHGWPLDWFFQQWLHTTNTLDYALTSAATTQLPDGRWRTRVEVFRSGEIWMPVLLQVGDVTRKLESRERTQVVWIDTRTRPREAVLDPLSSLIDINPANNRKAL